MNLILPLAAKKITLFNVIIALSMLFANGARAQTMPTMLDESNRFIRENTTQIDKSGWFYFKTEALLAPGELFTKYKEYTGLSENDQIYLVRTKEDPKHEMTHLRYQQYYKHLRIEGAEFDEHLQNCIVTVANGKLIEGLDLDTSPAYDESTALKFALNHIGADEYAWQNPEMERELQNDKDDPQATHFPMGELLWAVGNNPKIVKDSYILCWAFNISATKPYANKRIYINAQTGSIFADHDTDMSDGPATLVNGYGTKTIDTQWRGFPHQNHRLRTNNNGYNIHTKNTNGSGTGFIGTEFTDSDDIWNAASQSSTATAHWAVTEAWKYFKDTHNRSGMNNNNGYLKVLNNIGGLANAQYQSNSNKIVLGDPQSFANAGFPNVRIEALDVIGHEFTHGVINHTANLCYENEPGALNESFADIFGTVIESFTKGTSPNWTIGEDANFTWRNLQNPLVSPSPRIQPNQPDTYQGTNWATGTNDHGGVHTNSGVQNKWFYLLTAGDVHNQITINGIGTAKSAQICYYSLDNILQSYSNYQDARNAALLASNILFGGPCSNESIQVAKAWAACGLGTAPNCSSTIGIAGSSVYCTNNPSTSFYNAGVSGTSSGNFTWQYPLQWNVTISGVGNNLFTINNVGFYAHYPQVRTITATDNITGQSDTKTITILNNCGSICTTNVKGLNSAPKAAVVKDLTIYPNPASQTTYIYLADILNHDYQIAVYNMLGNVVQTLTTNTSTTPIDINQLSKGMYFIKVIDQANEEIFNTTKFIKE